MDHFAYKNGVYHAEDVNLSEVAEAVGTPFYCYSTATLTRHFQVFAESLSALSPTICYAMKANSNAAVVRTLANEGAGADVVSMGEIMLAQKAGIAPAKIIFSGVGKTAEEILNLDIVTVFNRLGIDRHISPQRKNGLNGMIQRIRAAAQLELNA